MNSLLQLRAPDWHGRNLDALWHSIVGGSINRRELPKRIVIGGATNMPVFKCPLRPKLGTLTLRLQGGTMIYNPCALGPSA
jgi:hypothetical protein